jgi:hypothetical protein
LVPEDLWVGVRDGNDPRGREALSQGVSVILLDGNQQIGPAESFGLGLSGAYQGRGEAVSLEAVAIPEEYLHSVDRLQDRIRQTFKALAEQGVLSENCDRAVSPDGPLDGATGSWPAPLVDVSVGSTVTDAVVCPRGSTRCVSSAEKAA